MSKLTQSQKAQAFDTLVEWLESESKKKRILGEGTDYEYHCGAINANKRALQKAQEIASQIAEQPEQAENMPPAGLDLSKHVGQTAVLWDGRKEPILKNLHVDEMPDFPFYIGNFTYTKAGAFLPNGQAHEFNIKTILP